MIIGKKTMRHVAAGLLGSFVSRNNNVERLWALGVLYTEALAANKRLELDLLSAQADPGAPASSSVARTYAAFLRSALKSHGFVPESLSCARVTVAFGLPNALTPPGNAFGDPFMCTVSLTSREGAAVARQAVAQCAPHESRLMARESALRQAGFTLFRAITERSKDLAGYWPLEVLRDTCDLRQVQELDLLGERAMPASPGAEAMARVYTALLRQLESGWRNSAPRW